MPILSVFAPLLKSRFFVIYYRCVTLADGMNGRRCFAQRIKKQRLPAAIALPLFTPAANYVILGTKARVFYDQNSVYLPREDLTQERHTKLCNTIPPFATGLPYLYYSHTTFQNNHISPQHDTKQHSRLHHRGGCFHLFDIWELALLIKVI